MLKAMGERAFFVTSHRKMLQVTGKKNEYSSIVYYRSLAKERLWVEHLTSLPKRAGVGAHS